MAFTKYVFFALAIAVIGVFLHISTALAEDKMVGQAAVVRGEVYVERGDSKIALKARDNVYQGDKVITGEKGKVQIIFADDSIFTIGKQAEILLDKYVYDPSTHEGESDVKAKKGTFKFVTGKLAKKNPKQVKVRTPFATIGVRGSGGVVDVAPNGITTVGLTQCCLDVFANGAPEGTPPVPLDDVSSYSRVENPNSRPTPPRPMPPEMVQRFNVEFEGFVAEDEGAFNDDAGTPPEENQVADDDSGISTEEEPDDVVGEEENAAGVEEESDPVATEDETQQKDDPRLADDGTAPPPPDGDDQQFVDGDGALPPPPEEGDQQFVDGDGALPPPPDGDQQFVDGDGALPPPLDGTFAEGDGDALPPPPDDGGYYTNDPLLTDGFGSFDGSEPLLTDGGDPLIGGDFNTDGDLLLTDPIDTGVTTDPVDTTVDVNQTTQDSTNSNSVTLDSNTFTHSGSFRTRQPGTSGAFDGFGSLSGKFLDTGGFLGEFTLSTGGTFTSALPTGAGSGFFGIPSVNFNNRLFSGSGFRTVNGGMVIYNLIDDISLERLTITAGTPMTSAQLPTTGLSFYDVLPDFLNQNQTGGFDLEGNGGGLIVDWQRQQFLGGSLTIDSTNNRYELTAAFGDVNGVSVLDGQLFSFESNYMNEGVYGVGTLTADTAYGDGTTVDGFILNSDYDVGNTGTGLLPRLDINPAVITPVVDPITLASFADRTETESLKGFAAGHIHRNVTGGGSFMKVTSGNNLLNVAINKTAGDIGAAFTLSNGGGFNIYAEFGSEGSSLGDSVFIADDAYAMEQGTMEMGGTPSAVDAVSGFLVSEVVAEQTCNTCQYTHWGVWAAKIDEAAGDGQIDTFRDTVNLLPYVVGNYSTTTEVAAQAGLAINHNGMMFGSLVANGIDISHHYGNFNLSGTFGTGFNFNGNFAGFNMFSSGITHSNVFSASLTVSGNGESGSGDINGAFFGPSAQEVGGNFGFNTTSYDAGGIFIGAQP
jgi:hypothetical protein